MSRSARALGLKPITEQPYKVVIAEDSFMDRMLVRRFLLYEAFQIVAEVENGQALVSTVLNMEEKPDIICVDYDMPVKNGVDAIKEIKQEMPEIKTVVITAHANKEMLQELHQLKIGAFIVKPFSKVQIEEKLARMLGRNDFLDKSIAGHSRYTVNLSEIKIPPMPTVVMKVLNFDSQKSGGSQELEKIISPDKAISANIIRIANSAFYGRSGKITSLKDAITLMGMKMIKNIVLVGFQKSFSNSLLQHESFQKQLHLQPILTSLITLDLLGPLKLDHLKENIFTLTLLRKVGMIVLALNFTKSYKDVLKLASVGIKTVFELESEVFTANSIEVGKQVFKIWKMPEVYTHVVENQNFHPKEIKQVSDLDRVIRLAEIIADRHLLTPLTEDKVELEDLIFAHYEAPPELKELFLDEDYYDNLKDHPFLEMSKS